MDKVLIDNWNNTVTDDDIIIHCGDFAFGNQEQIRNYAQQLNGNIILIRGNHDRKGVSFFESCGFNVVREHIGNQYVYTLTGFNDMWKIWEINKYIFSHAPLPDNLIPDESINIFGHIHDVPLSDRFNPNTHKCVSVECIDYKPLKLN